jgi:choline dehydrogenase-like flavoprotein
VEDAYDVVVVGSGFGGAITACRLSQAGRSVCILERGRRWRKEEFPRTRTGCKGVLGSQRNYGFLEYRGQGLDVIQAAGWRGSLHYFNVSSIPHGDSKKGWPKNLTPTPFPLRPRWDMEAPLPAPPVSRKNQAFPVGGRGELKHGHSCLYGPIETIHTGRPQALAHTRELHARLSRAC